MPQRSYGPGGMGPEYEVIPTPAGEGIPIPDGMIPDDTIDSLPGQEEILPLPEGGDETAALGEMGLEMPTVLPTAEAGTLQDLPTTSTDVVATDTPVDERNPPGHLRPASGGAR